MPFWKRSKSKSPQPPLPPEMADPEPDTMPELEKESTGSKITTFFKDQALKGALAAEAGLKKAAGLGRRPNVVPPGEATVSGPLRTVEIGWHPVAGISGKWFAERTGLGKMITEGINKYPDPTQHWAVLVDGFVHQLWMDEEFDIIYINEVLKRDDWHTFTVGKTRFNDEALRQTAEMTIHNMRTKRAAYNLISNNCQNFAINMLDAIQIGAHREFATSFAVYQRATGKGTIKDLFKDEHPEEQQQVEEEAEADEEGRPPRLQHTNTMQTAQIVMDQNTTKIDKHEHGYH